MTEERLRQSSAPPSALPLTEPELGQALHRHGLHLTRQGRAVYRQLAAGESHPTADEVLGALRPELPNLSLGTVYRNLQQFVTIGVALRLAQPDGGPARFDWRTERHAHFHCTDCGAVSDAALPEWGTLAPLLTPPDGADLTGFGLDLYGRCALCCR